MEVLNSKFILGTAQIGMNYGINNIQGLPSRSESAHILERAQSLEINCLDTATSYGFAHEIISQYHQDHPKFQIISKVSQKDLYLYDIEKILSSLNISKLEALLFHNYDDYTNKANKAKVLHNKESNKVNKIGVSVYTLEQARQCALDSDLDLIQLPLNLLDNYTKKREVIELAKQKGKEIHVRSIFLQGLFLKNSTLGLGNLSPLQKYIDALKNIALEMNISIEKLAISYVYSCLNIDRIIFGVEQENQLVKNMNNIVLLDYEVIRLIERIYVEEEELLSPLNWKL